MKVFIGLMWVKVDGEMAGGCLPLGALGVFKTGRPAERDIKLVVMSFVERLSSFIDSLKRYSGSNFGTSSSVPFREIYCVPPYYNISEGPLSKVQPSLSL